MLIQLTRAEKYDSRSMEPCYVESDEIAAIQACSVGERSVGSQITLKCGDKLEVWQDPNLVRRRIATALGEGD